MDAVRVVTTEGIVWLDGLSVWDRAVGARHKQAIITYLDTGRTEQLKPFAGVQVGGLNGTPVYTLEADWQGLEALGLHGEVSPATVRTEADMPVGPRLLDDRPDPIGGMW